MIQAPVIKVLLVISKSMHKCVKMQSHEIVRLPNRTICEKHCGCKTSLQFYLDVVFAYLCSMIGSN